VSRGAAFAAERRAGLLVPLFALRGAGERGIGEIGDLPAFCRWLAAAGHGLLQLLPIVEMSLGERSPYAAMSAFAIDPIYLSLDGVEHPAGPDDAIDYDGVRAAKRRTLEASFATFDAQSESFVAFRAREAHWLDDYALFRACQERHGARPWTEWEPALRDHEPSAVAAARATLARECLFHEYGQWLAAEQWGAARAAAAAVGVHLKGDLPFIVSANSADVWARQDEFALDVTLGAPPDAFNAEGQDWGLPVCRWDVMATNGFGWLRARAARAAGLFDAFRIDHVVGFYRQYTIRAGGRRGFVPDDEDEQLALGERLLTALADAAGPARVIGEDLGVVPPFVRRSLGRLGIPGYRVLRWEDDAGAFRDPARWPAVSVATTGTHDTSALATWWEGELDPAARRALAAVPVFAGLRAAGATFTPAVHAALLDGLYAAGSALVVLPFPDAYGGRERINVPATVGRANWGYRVPRTLARLDGPESVALGARLRALAERHGRR
jgi:4-alpha-glucanotransferase